MTKDVIVEEDSTPNQRWHNQATGVDENLAMTLYGIATQPLRGDEGERNY
ncbi:MAG: hypothetical protein KGJ59_01270 [Bacteroidota bacterium]|nr:hypothetical protein [Bacteroidota bacterium]